MRRRFVYREDDEGNVHAVEIGDDYQLAERRAPVTTEGVVYSNARATNGTDLSSRKRHRDYLKQNNLAMYSDYEKSMPKLEESRKKIALGDADTRERKQQIYDSMQRLKSQRRGR